MIIVATPVTVTVGFREMVVAMGVGAGVLITTIVVGTTGRIVVVSICVEGVVAAVTMTVTKTEAVWGIADVFVAKVVRRKRRGGMRRILWVGGNAMDG